MDHQLISESPNSTDDFMPSSVDSSDYAQISDESVLPEISYPQCSFQSIDLQHKCHFLQSCLGKAEVMSREDNHSSSSHNYSGSNDDGRFESHSSCNLSSNVLHESATSEHSYLSHLCEHNPEVYLLPSCRHKSSNLSDDNISIIDCDEGQDECEEDNKDSDFSIDETSGDSESWISCPDISLRGSCGESMTKRKPNLNNDGLDTYWSKKFCRIPPSSCYSDPEGCDVEDRNDDSNPVNVQNYSETEHLSEDMKGWLDTFQNWGHSNRLLALDHLINSCELPQVRYMMEIIEPQFQRDFISLLPKELALYVLTFLEPKDLLKAAQTCRYWRILAEDNLLWREKCKEIGMENFHEFMGRRRHFGSNLNSGIFPSPWKTAYMRQHNIEMNWRHHPIKPSKILKGHDDHVITCLQFSGNRVVSGSDDNTLRVWSATTGKCLRTLVGHTGGVWSSQMSGNIIISGSTDRTLKVWNAESGACIHTLHGHSSTVRCMHLHGTKVVSGSRDATLRVWDVDSGHCLHVLMGHLAAVRCVQYDGRLVVSGAYDYLVKVWNPEREECLHTLQGHTNRVYSLQFDGVHVVSGSLDTSIRVWDVETGQCKHTLMGHQSLTSGMELKNNILVSGNADSTVKVWDINTGQCLQTLSGSNKHQSAVTCLQFNNKFVITSSDDGTVKLWDVKTGEFVRNLVILESGGSGGVVWRLKANHTKLVCAVGSRNGTEETKLLVLDFDVLKK